LCSTLSGWAADLRLIDHLGRLWEHWMSSGLKRELGNGNDICFWSNKWMSNTVLSEKFSRLYRLARDKGNS
ncbi:hypothetical protein Ancab_016543, partial [Ancistrocladus abbreviatus]